MKNGMHGIINKLARKKNAVQFQWLTGFVSGFKTIPANGKRWKKGEHPDRCEIRYFGTYEDALELLKGKDAERIAVILWLPRAEFEKLVEAEKQ